MKATAKVNANAKSKPETKVEVVVPISATIKTQIDSAATSEKGVMAATTQAKKSILNLGKTIRKELSQKFERKDVQRTLMPLFSAAYEKIGREKLYAGQQLSRALGFAYASSSNFSAAEKEESKGELDVNKILQFATGSLSRNKKGEVVKVKKSNRGGKNAKTPIETFGFDLDNAVTAAKVAKLKLDALTVRTVEAFTANGHDLEDVKASFESALQD